MGIGGGTIRGLHQTGKAILVQVGIRATEEVHDERE